MRGKKREIGKKEKERKRGREEAERKRKRKRRKEGKENGEEIVNEVSELGEKEDTEKAIDEESVIKRTPDDD